MTFPKNRIPFNRMLALIKVIKFHGFDINQQSHDKKYSFFIFLWMKWKIGKGMYEESFSDDHKCQIAVSYQFFCIKSKLLV